MIDWRPVLSFLSYLEGALPAAELLRHPAYLAIQKHARAAYGIDLTADDLDRGTDGRDSPFFGLREVRANAERIRDFVALGQSMGHRWCDEVRGMLEPLAGAGAADGLIIYPVVGYDAGIGLDGVACLNVNWRVYLDRPQEFVYMMAHEAMHAVYGRTRPFPAGLPAAGDREAWHGLFCRLTQDEGYAVYASLAVRRRRGHLGDDSHPILFDYVVLEDQALTRASQEDWVQACALLASGGGDLGGAECLELIAGPRRLTYRTGCSIIDLLARLRGPEAVRAAFTISPSEFSALGLALLQGR